MGHPRLPDPPKSCEACGKTMSRKKFKSHMEARSTFSRRRFCDRKCMATGMQKENPTRSAYLMRARKHLKSTCETCGTTAKLSIHHVDLNWRNNAPSNLMTLCTSCHTTWHHERGHIVKKAIKPPCVCCGKPSYRISLCSTHLTRFRRYGDPYLRRIRVGSSWQLVKDAGGLNGQESIGR